LLSSTATTSTLVSTGSALQMGAGSSTLLTVTSSAIGIGNSNPSAMLHMKTTTSSAQIQIDSSGGNTLYLIGNSSGAEIVTTGAQMTLGGGANIQMNLSANFVTTQVPLSASAGILLSGTVQTGYSPGPTFGTLKSTGATTATTTSVGFSMTSTGSLLIAGEVDCHSDERAKTAIAPLDPAECLDKVESIAAVSYVWNDGREDLRPKLGFIAQDVCTAGVSEAVSLTSMTMPNGTRLDDYHVLDKDQLLAVLWGAVQGLNLKISNLSVSKM